MAPLHDPLAALKQHELSEAIALCTGLWLDAASDKFAVTPGGSLKFDATALNRDHMAVQVKSVDIEGISPATTKDKFGGVLPFNEPQVLRSDHHHPRAPGVVPALLAGGSPSKATPTPSRISSTSVCRKIRRCSRRIFICGSSPRMSKWCAPWLIAISSARKAS